MSDVHTHIMYRIFAVRQTRGLPHNTLFANSKRNKTEKRATKTEEEKSDEEGSSERHFLLEGSQVSTARPSGNSSKGKVKCTPVKALRLCAGRTAHRGSRGIALLFLDHGTRRE
jgi:hypothetical protein